MGKPSNGVSLTFAVPSEGTRVYQVCVNAEGICSVTSYTPDHEPTDSDDEFLESLPEHDGGLS